MTGNPLTFTYDASGTPLSVTYNGTTYYYVTNLQSDVTAILNTSGSAVVAYTYDAWGNPQSEPANTDTIGNLNPLRYRGYVYDTETGLYYLQSRYYDPEVGRFINADVFAATGLGLLGNNMFAYCLNNPIILCDRTGCVPSRSEVFPIIFHDTGNPIYESEEEAAFAAGVRVRILTNGNDHEYICGIYGLNDGGYMVGSHFEGEHASADPKHLFEESNGYSDRALIAMVHSHPYCTGHVPNEFSMFDQTGQPTGDFAVAIQTGIPIYLAAPNGNLMKLHVISITPTNNGRINMRYVQTVICGGLPGDNTIYNCRR